MALAPSLSQAAILNLLSVPTPRAIRHFIAVVSFAAGRSKKFWLQRPFPASNVDATFRQPRGW
jgi:hypothetical protein